MIIHDLYVAPLGRQVTVLVSNLPDEADTPLVVDTDAVLSGAVSLQGFQPVPRRHAQAVAANSSIELQQLPQRGCLDVSGQLSRGLVVKDFRCFFVAKTEYHTQSVSQNGV